MEALIFGLVIMAVSAFFSKGKKDSADDAPEKPVPTRSSTGTDRRSGQKTFKRVEDYAKEIYGELQNQKTQRPELAEKAKKKVEEAVNRTPLREARQEVQRRVPPRETRNEIHDRIKETEASVLRSRPPAPGVEKDMDELLPLSSDDIRRGIIMAEILMPPKSKR
ncbi:dsDNA-specific endonuclease/ATPase MutS2 [Planomicrobium stackebrandtii]|uniref:DsDNA-specific endonuclease/ATPase MutS2 n=1 Tax=Planomicrobium stackebrandtii TaxID=253160 RepID=A0ABU0GYX3_9BACL|nr:hypothetical protein [Planomicrobium stackebrandtii]MDQ0430011.1 dsDNA-specific endonuclease/ATPase MutS2 [Planomicrobium stackebrandtii]